MEKINKLSTFYDHIADLARQKGIKISDALSLVKGMGIDFLEVSEVNLGKEPALLKSQMEDAGLEISTVPAYFNFGEDRDVKSRALPLLETLGELGVKALLVIPGFIPRDLHDEDERKAKRDAMAWGINELAVLSKPYGITLLMEDFDNEAAPFSTMRGVRKFLDDCPDLCACFDTGNFRYMAEDELEAYELLRDRLRYVHLKDRAYFGAPGEVGITAIDGQKLYSSPVGGGEIKMEEIIARLKDDGYKGVLSIEHYGAPDMEGYLRQSVGWLRQRLSQN